MKLGLLCHLNWILIFRISFHLLKTQLQKCFIKPCFKKYHMFDLSLKYIFSQNYMPHIKKNTFFFYNDSTFGAALTPGTMSYIHTHQGCFHCLGFIPCSSFTGFVKVLPCPVGWCTDQRRSVHPLVAHSKFLIVPFLSALQSWGTCWFLCWPCSSPLIHPQK